MQKVGVAVPEAYADFARSVFERMSGARSGPLTRPLDVAEAIRRAANERSCPIRQAAGADALALAEAWTALAQGTSTAAAR